MMKTFVETKRILLFFLCFSFLFGCGKEDASSVNGRDGIYITDFYTPKEQLFANIAENESPLFMGGKEYFGGIILGDTENNNQNSHITYEIDKGIKYVSFFLGSVHYPKSYFSNNEVVSVLIDGELFLEEVIFNHSLPEYYEIFVDGAEEITFKTSGESILAAVGEFKAWNEKPYGENEPSILPDTAMLMYDIKPYYVSEGNGLSCIYSKNGKKTDFLGNEYTNALEISFPRIEKWSNDAFAYFNLEGKYSFLSFNFGVEFLESASKKDSQNAFLSSEENKQSDSFVSGEKAKGVFGFLENDENYSDKSASKVENPLAVLEIYADGFLAFSVEMTAEKLEGFRIPIKNCEQLCFVWKSVPFVQDLKCITSGIYAES